jgi:hypothetical protein
VRYKETMTNTKPHEIFAVSTLFLALVGGAAGCFLDSPLLLGQAGIHFLAGFGVMAFIDR